MEKLADAKLLNLIVCFIVVGLGAVLLYIFDQKWKGKYRFLYRAFTWWWLSWISWVAAWLSIKFSFLRQDIQEVLSLVLSDLNAIFLLLIYFTLTRGNQFRLKDALYRSSVIILALAISFWSLRLYIPSSPIANELQQSLELCLGVIATMLLGWAFALRFNTNVVLGVGFVYSFLQPIAYMTIFHTEDRVRLFPQLFITAITVLAFMKIVLATVVTWYLMQEPETTENLVKESKSRSYLKLFRGKTKVLELQTFILVGLFVVFLTLRMKDFLDPVVKVITKLAVVYTVLMGAVKLWDRYIARPTVQDNDQKIETQDKSVNS